MDRSSEDTGHPRLVLAKLARPVLPDDCRPRPRLAALFGRILHQKLLCVVAPAGYGKTCAALQYARYLEGERPGSVAWLSVDAQDNDPLRFWMHVHAALGLPSSLLDEADPCGEDALVAAGNALFEKLGADDERFLFVDGFDLAGNAEVELSFLRFCSYAPGTFHVVVTANAFSRRLGAEACLLGQEFVGADELALSLDEARELLEGMLGGELDEGRAATVHRMAEGWVQGLVIAGQALASGARRGEPACFDGANRLVRRYFEGHVRTRLPGDLMSFLLELSVLERFNRSLCDAVFDGGDTQALFSEMVRRNLFVAACDDRDDWYRFNNLFADWLRNEALQLRAETVREISARASEWFHDHDRDLEAAKYLLLASDFAYVANLTEATCSLSRADRATSPLLWLCRIPAASFVDSPLMCMLAAWSAITNARVADAQVWIGRFERSMRNPENEGCLDPGIVEFSSKCLTMKCTAMAGDGRMAVAQCDELLGSGYEIKPSLMSMIYQSLGEAYERVGDMAQAQEIYLQAQASASVDATTHQLMFNAFNFAAVQYSFGELDDAREGCEKLLQACPSDFAIYGAICALLARVLLERNEKERALVLVERSLKRTSHYRHIDMYLEAKIAQAGCLSAAGRLSEAYEAIVEGILHGERKDVPRAVLLHAYFHQAEIAARRRNLRDLAVIERKFAARVHEGDVYCRLLLSFVRAFAERERGDAGGALATLEEVVACAREGRFACVSVRALAVQAVTLASLGEGSRARVVLNELLALASRHGFVRSLLDAGEPMRDLLRDYASARKAGAPVRAYVKSLLLAFEKELPTVPVDLGEAGSFANDGPAPLTPRELEILKLLNMGMSRQEIAEVLCISVNTAKKHLANIYSKLGVGTREEALERYAADRSTGRLAKNPVRHAMSGEE